MQAEDSGCLWGCGLALAALPITVILQHIDERNKRKVERLKEETEVLRLEAERERLKTERDDAVAARKSRKMRDAGYVRCTRCGDWRDEVDADGVCEPCHIVAEIDSAME